MVRLKEHYREVVRPKLREDLGYGNDYQVPRIEKVVINMGVGEAANDSKKIQGPVDDMTRISGQKPVVVLARTSVASFRLREGTPVGVKVTLRGDRMYEFIDRLITIALPRVRDFRGLNLRSFDGHGNFSMGVKEQIIFAEIEYDKVESVRGMDICITTTARTDDEARALLRGFDFPFAAQQS